MYTFSGKCAHLPPRLGNVHSTNIYNFKEGKCTLNDHVVLVNVSIQNNQIEDKDGSFELNSVLNEKKILIDNARKKARENLENQAIKMCNLSKEKFPAAVIGDNVRVSIPDVDRGKTDPKNLICVVLSRDDDKNLYKLRTKQGVLKQSHSRHEFAICEQKFISYEDVPQDVEKSVREIIGMQSLTGGQGFKRCICKGTCSSKKCSCKNAGILCNSKCHNSNSCSNK